MIEKVLEKMGFNVERQKDVSAILLQNYHCASVTSRKNETCFNVSFNGMKPTFGRSKTVNENYQSFIDDFQIKFSNLNYVISDSGVLTVKDLDTEELENLFAILDIKNRFSKVISFNGLWKNYKLKELQFDGKTCIYRDIKNELAIVREAFTANTYEHHGMTFDKEDVVLDLGANIGCFTLSIFNRVKQIVALEPEHYNCEIMRMNMERNHIKNCELFEAAVVGNHDKTRKLYCGWCAGTYSLHTDTHQRVSVDVECMNIQDLINKYDPTKIKFDIKGSEIECINNITNWGRVNQAAFDYCFDINGDLKNNHRVFEDFKQKLRAAGFDVTPMERNMKSNWNLVFLVNRK